MGRTKYGSWWDKTVTDLDIEMEMIRLGGRFLKDGHWYGNGLFFHYKCLWELLWPDEEVDPWAELALKSFCENKTTVL